MEDFLRANLEQLETAASAGYAVQIAWNPKLKRKATLCEVVSFAKACCDVPTQQKEELKALLPTEPRRKSQRLRA